MSLSAKEIDFREKQIQQFVESQRPKEEIRDQLDVGYEWKDNTLVLFEIRPDWEDETVVRHFNFAKARYIKSKNKWKIFWLRESGKWEGYRPQPEVDRLDQVFDVIKEDALACFRG